MTFPGPGRTASSLFSVDLLLNALVAGVLLGGFYAAVSLGLTVSFGQLNIVNIATRRSSSSAPTSPTCATAGGIRSEVLVGLAFTPVFFLIGVGVYRIYYESFERKGRRGPARLAFFFG